MRSVSEAKSIFQQAVELPADDRAGFLDEACGDDARLRREVDELLQFDPGAVEVQGPDPLAPATAASPRSHPIGSFAGPYEILADLGEGGSADVYLARRRDATAASRVSGASGCTAPFGSSVSAASSVSSGSSGSSAPSGSLNAPTFASACAEGEVVALKVLRRRDSTPRWRYRFEREAQILADLKHPGIARLIDSGIFEDGRPFLAMERIDGESLATYANAGALTTTERLALFVLVCDAVDHGHRRGIVHRDLKPTNILVRRDTRAPVLIDFGLARLALDDTPVATTTAGLAGTPAYMAPEQAGRDIRAARDPAVDVYALGVVLFELLTDRLPIGDRSLPPLAMVHAKLHEEPLRLGAVDLRFRGDLETIAGKALQRDPSRRYASAAALAADVRDHLAHRPIAARPPGTWEDLARLAGRHRTAATVAAGIVLVLIVVTASAMRIAAQSRRHMADILRLIERDDSLLTFDINAVARLAGTAPQRVDRIQQHLDDYAPVFAQYPRHLQLARYHRQALSALGDALLDSSRLDRAFVVRSQALSIATRVVSLSTKDDVESIREQLTCQVQLADIRKARGDLGRAFDEYEAVLRAHEDLHQRHPSHPGVLDDLFWSVERVRWLADRLGDRTRSVEMLDRLEAIAAGAPCPPPGAADEENWLRRTCDAALHRVGQGWSTGAYDEVPRDPSQGPHQVLPYAELAATCARRLLEIHPDEKWASYRLVNATCAAANLWDVHRCRMLNSRCTREDAQEVLADISADAALARSDACIAEASARADALTTAEQVRRESGVLDTRVKIHSTLVWIHERRQERALAVQACERAIALARVMHEACPENTLVATELHTFEGWLAQLRSTSPSDSDIEHSIEAETSSQPFGY